MKPRRYLDEEVDVIASLRNLKGLWSDVVGIARARPVAAVFVGMILLVGVLPRPPKPLPATELTEAQGCALGRATAERWGFSTITQCTFTPKHAGGRLRGKLDWVYAVTVLPSGAYSVKLFGDTPGKGSLTPITKFEFDRIPE